MKDKGMLRRIPWLIVLAMIMGFLAVYSPFTVAQEQSGGILFIIGNRAEESPVSGVEIEIYRNQPDGSRGEKIGNFISRSEKTGDGQITIDLENGSYSYRVVTKEYQLTGKQEWENFEIEGSDKAVLLWVRPNGEEETIIEEEEVAKGVPNVAFNTERTTEEMHANAKGDHRGFHLDLMSLLDISNNVWLTLGFLATIILGVIGIDYLMRLRKH